MGCRYSPQRMDEYMTWTSTVGEWGEFFQKTLSLLASENINGLRERPAPRVHSSMASFDDICVTLLSLTTALALRRYCRRLRQLRQN